MGKIFYWIENAFDFGVFFWNTKFCSILKLSALWGLIVLIIGGIIQNETLQLVGCAMCGGFALMLVVMGIFFILVILIVIIDKLLSYTERVLFGKNKIFV